MTGMILHKNSIQYDVNYKHILYNLLVAVNGQKHEIHWKIHCQIVFHGAKKNCKNKSVICRVFIEIKRKL